MVSRRDLVVAVLLAFCVTASLFTITMTRGLGGGYDPWLDVTDDGYIGVDDIYAVATHFGFEGTPVAKGSIEYDSGWINITDKAGQNVTIVNGLNLNMNDANLGFDITGKTSLDDQKIQRYLGLTGNAQGWNQTYGGTDDDRALVLVRTVDGGYALAGYTYSYGAGYVDSWLVKTDSSGNVQWNQTYGGTGGDYAFALVRTVDGGYALAGQTNSSGAGKSDFWLVKTDLSGNAQWNQTYGGIGGDYARALVQTADGGYALAGWTNSSGAGGDDFWLVKTDSSGNAQWNQTYGGTNEERAFALVQAADDGYVLAGNKFSYGAGYDDSWLVKTDLSGNVQWNQTYGGTYLDRAYALVQAADGGYALAGCTTSYGAGNQDFWLVKTDLSGNAQWNRTYGGTSYDSAQALVQAADGGYALAGPTSSYGAGNLDFWLVRTDVNGNAQWNKTYGGTNVDYAYALVRTADGGYALAGSTGSYGAGPYDFWLVKTDVGSGLAWVDSDANSITLHRGLTDVCWNFVRVRIWKPRGAP